MILAAIIIGIFFVGFCFGVFVMSLMAVAARGNEVTHD